MKDLRKYHARVVYYNRTRGAKPLTIIVNATDHAHAISRAKGVLGQDVHILCTKKPVLELQP